MDPDEGQSFGALLRSYRVAAHLTQQRLAEQAGIGPRTLRALEHGTHQPLKGTVERLVGALNMQADSRTTLLAAASPRARRRPLSATTARLIAAGRLAESGAGLRHTLPPVLTNFVGRAREKEEVAYLLRQRRLVTLTGPGGVGKTRLALHVAAALQEQYPQGACVVELAPVSEPAAVPRAVAAALGLHPAERGPLVDIVVAVLRPQTLLLVLDNCEHLLDACARLVETLLKECPNLHILVTSRERLSLTAETVFALAPLAVPDPAHVLPIDQLARVEAVQLFVDRATATQPAFALSPANAAAVARLCARLDGLPLALELAAARVNSLGIDTLASLLDRCFDLLTGGQRTALPRQQTLRAAVDWSYNLMGPDEQALWVSLAVFAGRFSLAAAEAVFNDLVSSASAADLLAHLVDKSLVQAETSGTQAQYWLLETMRRYAWERLEESGAQPMVQERHAAYYAALAARVGEQFRANHGATWLDTLESGLDNFRQAMAWYLRAPDPRTLIPGEGEEADRAHGEYALRLATDLQWLGYWRSYRPECLAWLEQALARYEGPPLLRASSMSAAGYLAAFMGERARSDMLLTLAVALYRELGATRELAEALIILGFCRRGLWHDDSRDPAAYDAGTAPLEEGLTLARQTGDAATIAQAEIYAALTVDLRRVEERQRAKELADESVRLFRELGDALGIATYNQVIGGIAAYEGDTARAAAAFAAHVAGRRALDDPAGVAVGLLFEGELALRLGDYERAEACLEESLAIYRSISFDRKRMARVLRGLGELALGRGQHDRARDYFGESLRRASETGALGSVAGSLEGLACLASAEDQAPRALQLAGAAAGLRARNSQPLSPHAEASLVLHLMPARAMLSQDEQAAHWTVGWALMPDQAIAEALHEPDEQRHAGSPSPVRIRSAG